LRKELRMDDRSPLRPGVSSRLFAEAAVVVEEEGVTYASSTRRSRMHRRPGGGGWEYDTVLAMAS